jgi:hypothetical protein
MSMPAWDASLFIIAAPELDPGIDPAILGDARHDDRAGP